MPIQYQPLFRMIGTLIMVLQEHLNISIQRKKQAAPSGAYTGEAPLEVCSGVRYREKIFERTNVGAIKRPHETKVWH